MVAFSSKTVFGVVGVFTGLVLAGTAQAQSLSTNSANFNAGYGRVAGQENRAVDYSTRDENGNRVIIDGVIQTGEDQSYFSRNSGVGGGGSGVGSTAIGNNLVVVTQGSWNTVIVNSKQTNNGNVTAGSNGGVGGN